MESEFNLISNKKESQSLIEEGFQEYIEKCSGKELMTIECDLRINTADGVFNWITINSINKSICKLRLKQAEKERFKRAKKEIDHDSKF